MQKIGTGSGVSVYRDDTGAVHVVDAGTANVYTVVYVIGLFVVIIGLGGLMTFGMGLSRSQTMWLGGLAMVAMAGAGGYGFVRSWKSLKRRNARPPDEQRTKVVFDMAAGVLRDANGTTLAPLGDVRVHRKFQVTSSSPALAVSWGDNTVILARGNPFAGGLGSLIPALSALGIEVT